MRQREVVGERRCRQRSRQHEREVAAIEAPPDDERGDDRQQRDALPGVDPRGQRPRQASPGRVPGPGAPRGAPGSIEQPLDGQQEARHRCDRDRGATAPRIGPGEQLEPDDLRPEPQRRARVQPLGERHRRGHKEEREYERNGGSGLVAAHQSAGIRGKADQQRHERDRHPQEQRQLNARAESPGEPRKREHRIEEQVRVADHVELVRDQDVLPRIADERHVLHQVGDVEAVGTVEHAMPTEQREYRQQRPYRHREQHDDHR